MTGAGEKRIKNPALVWLTQRRRVGYACVLLAWVIQMLLNKIFHIGSDGPLAKTVVDMILQPFMGLFRDNNVFVFVVFHFYLILIYFKICDFKLQVIFKQI